MFALRVAIKNQLFDFEDLYLKFYKNPTLPDGIESSLPGRT